MDKIVKTLGSALVAGGDPLEVEAEGVKVKLEISNCHSLVKFNNDDELESAKGLKATLLSAADPISGSCGTFKLPETGTKISHHIKIPYFLLYKASSISKIESLTSRF